jgi:antitoxin HicB
MSQAKQFDHSGSSFDSFLEEEGLLQDVETMAMKRVIAWELQNAMKLGKVTKQRMAARLKTSRSQIDRLLDPEYVGVGLDTVSKAAHALGKRVSIQFVDVRAKTVRRKTVVKRAS